MRSMGAVTWCASSALSDTLIIAPAGCGKTELLALRAAQCVHSGILPRGRRILALTFTNKARDNLAGRLAEHIGPGFRKRVSVMNFHGLGLHLYRTHGYVLDDPVRDVLPNDRAIRAMKREAFERYSVPREGQSVVEVVIRKAKSGAFSDDEVLSRIKSSGDAAAYWYEQRLRGESRLDYDDILRLGLQILQHSAVADLYAQRFAYVLVDEAQDLTRPQYGLVEAIGRGCTVFAGDRSQGIFSFAGAVPDWVFQQIYRRDPVRVDLNRSYRSSPEVLKVVSALAKELGGEALTSADPDRWRGRGRVSLVRFNDQRSEAVWLGGQIRKWRQSSAVGGMTGGFSIGILTRMKVDGRRDVFLDHMEDEGIEVEVWDNPLHRVEVVRLLRRYVDAVLATVPDPTQQIEELYLRCSSDIPPENVLTAVDLRDAVDELAALIPNEDLYSLIDQMRTSSDAHQPVGPGVHLLTGHAGKGQAFDKVVIMGFEEGQIPSFHVKRLPDSDSRVREELALLHVMASRAKEELLFTICANANGYPQRPSRWLSLVKPYAIRVK